MTKAREWAAACERAEAARMAAMVGVQMAWWENGPPRIAINGQRRLEVSITSRGEADVKIERANQSAFIRLSPDEAVSLGRWLSDTFGETESPR